MLIKHSISIQYQRIYNRPAFSSIVCGKRVGYLGIKDSFSYLAARQFFTDSEQYDRYLGFDDFSSITDALCEGKIDYGILPIENTTSGVLPEVYDLIRESKSYICGEVVLPIRHHLLSVGVSDLPKIRHIYAHPQAIMQCSRFLRTLSGVTIHQCESSAHAAAIVANRNCKAYAAICGEAVLNEHPLQLVKEAIDNCKNSNTRFVCISRTKQFVEPQVATKTSVIFTTKQNSGALAEILSVFHAYDIVLTKIQSRPIPQQPWQELFFADFDGHPEQPNVHVCLSKLKKLCTEFEIIGHYAKAKMLPQVEESNKPACKVS